MSALSDRMELLQTQLQAALPARIVTRSYQDFAQRHRADLLQGVYTLISQGVQDINSPVNRQLVDGNHGITLVGQILLAETATGEQVEEAELTLWDEISGFLRNPPDYGLCLDAVSMRQSGQLEAPYGWILVDLMWREFD